MTTPTPCSDVPCDTGPGEPCEKHEREWAHAEGDHELCGPECTAGLRQRIADAIRAAACTGDCDSTEEECRDARIQPVVWHWGVLAEVSATPDQIAAVLLPLVAAERADALREGAAKQRTEMHAPGRSYDAARWNRCVDMTANVIDPGAKP